MQSLAVVAAIAAYTPPLARATGLPEPVAVAAWAGRFADSQYRHAVLASPMLSRRRFVQSLAVVTAFAPSLARATGLPEPGAVAALVGLPGLHGPALAAAEIAGRPLVVAFWASWCPPCRDEFVHLNRIHDAYADAGIAVIGVNVHEAVAGTADPERLARFLDGTAPRFRLVGGDADLLRIFGEIDAIPAVYVFDRLGEVTYAFQPSREPGRTHVTAGELARVLRNMGY